MSSVTDAPDNLMSIQWQDQSEDFRQWLAARADIELRRLAPGVEAHTWALARGGRPEYVLKVWNKGFTADAKEQHRFLSHARHAGLPVPRSVGWGRDEGGHQILATRFAGYPIDRPIDEQIRRCAHLLAQVHATPVGGFECAGYGHEDPLDYLLTRYFPRLEHHPDIAAILEQLKAAIPRREAGLIHGDYNLGNVLVAGERMTIIDWSNAHVGDIRYDTAWASTLLWIYGQPHHASVFLQAYEANAAGLTTRRERAMLEAIAALRWILLNRSYSVPLGSEKQQQVVDFVHRRLPEPLWHILRKP
jgi:aminoglycoside phosphotransferase (APT) family kinase protein